MYVSMAHAFMNTCLTSTKMWEHAKAKHNTWRTILYRDDVWGRHESHVSIKQVEMAPGNNFPTCRWLVHVLQRLKIPFVFSSFRLWKASAIRPCVDVLTDITLLQQ